MVTKVGTQDVASNLAGYLLRASHDGERILLEEEGRPLAALVSVEDLERLEGELSSNNTIAREVLQARFQRDMTSSGAITFPSGPAVPLADRRRIHVRGPLISEDIIADRR